MAAPDLLRFLSLLVPAQQVQGGAWWSSEAYYTVWNGRGWLNTRKLTADAAREWQIDQFEAMGGHQPLANIQLWKWSGKAWTKAS